MVLTEVSHTVKPLEQGVGGTSDTRSSRLSRIGEQVQDPELLADTYAPNLFGHRPALPGPLLPKLRWYFSPVQLRSPYQLKGTM